MRLCHAGRCVALCNNAPYCFLTRKLIFATRKPIFVTRKLIFATRKLIFATRKLIFVTRKLIFATRKPIFVTRKLIFATRKPVFLNKFQQIYLHLSYFPMLYRFCSFTQAGALADCVF
ncbi:hypothetical protein NIES4103_46000 [Nostoc sp. NIES-4103]|nr:hypothetical protein NIES4103_46000 [Nostoc sp. NIES-4103]